MCVCSVSVILKFKKMGHDNKLVNKCRHMLYWFHAMYVLFLLKLSTNLRLLFKVLLVFSVSIYLFWNQTDDMI